MGAFRGILLIALGAAGAIAVDRLVLSPEPPQSDGPAVARSEPAPGGPPLAWLGGTLEEVGDGSLTIREGEGPRVELDRAAAGGTRFFRLNGKVWTRLSEQESASVQAGQAVCVEALLDGQNLLALRVFLGVGCGPG